MEWVLSVIEFFPVLIKLFLNVQREGNDNNVCECARLQVEQVRLLDRFSNKSTHGTLYLTATHLIFVESSSSNTPAGAQEIWVST